MQCRASSVNVFLSCLAHLPQSIILWLQVPKAIMHYMVNHTKKGLQTNLIQQLYK